MRGIKARFLYYFLFAYCLGSAGCASVTQPQAAVPAIPGFYHQITKGQTLFGISRMYAVDLDELTSLNRIADATRIEAGQLLFIPGTQKSQKNAQEYPQEDFIWPVKGRVIASFGQVFNNMINKGITIQASEGTPVLAARSGKVVFCSDSFLSFGKTVIIDHGDGFLSVYANIEGVLAQPGTSVRKGAVIAKVGPSGRRGSAYLHFQIRKRHFPQNPYFFLPD